MHWSTWKEIRLFSRTGNGPRPTSNHGVDTSEADRLHGIISSQQSRLDSQDVELQEQKKTIDQLESKLSQFEGMMQQFFSSQGSVFRFTDSATQWLLISMMSLEYLELVSILNWSSLDLFDYCWCMSYL